MANTYPHSLPWEVLIHVLNFVPRCHLFPLLLVCRSLHKLVEPLLYRHINLSNSPTRSLYLFRTLLNCDDLCRHVQTFVPAERHPKPNYIDRLRWIVRGRDEKYQRPRAYSLLAQQAAVKLVQVIHISIPTANEQSIQKYAGMAQIKKFRTTSSYGLRGRLGIFFESMPNLTHLELPFDVLFLYGETIQPHYVPFLEGLMCPTNFAPFLVPGRPIKRLFLVWSARRNPPDSAELMEEMARSTEIIKGLGLFLGRGVNWRLGFEGIFSAAATFHPDVEELTVWFECLKESSGILKRLLRELSENLKHFSKLRVLDLNGSTGYGVVWFDHWRNAISAAYTNILQLWSNDCPNLEKVIFPNGANWVKEPIPRRSKRPDRRTRPTPKSLPPRSDVAPDESNIVPHLEYDHKLEPNLDSSLDQDGVVSNNLSGSTPEIGISMTDCTQVEPPRKVTEATSTTHHGWRCVNPYSSHSNRPKWPSITRGHGPELGWDTPMFKRDLKKGWVKEFPISSA